MTFAQRRAAADGRGALRKLLAALFAVLAAFAAGAAAAAVDEIAVKFRDDSRWSNLSAAAFAVSKALAVPVSEVGRTRDGAIRYALDPSIAFDALRAAVNRLRMDPEVLYVKIGAPVQAAPGAGNAGEPGPPLHRIIVKYRDPALAAAVSRNEPLDSARLARIGAIAGQAVAHERAIDWAGAYVVRLSRRLPVDEVEAIAAALEREPDVEWAQPDYRDHILVVPNDPLYTSQWHYFAPASAAGGADLPTAWDRSTGLGTVRIAVIDTGALFNHPDLAGRFVGGYDFVLDYVVANDGDPVQPGTCLPTSNPLLAPCISSRDADPSDPGDWVTFNESIGVDWGGWLNGCQQTNSSWHGSHVAGTIGAASNNADGVAGINWIAKIVPVRVLGKCGGYVSDIADGLTWASGGSVAGAPPNPYPARVLNLSIGGRRANQQCDALYQAAVNGALSRNVVVAVAAGNNNEDASYNAPGNCNGVITVAAVGRNGQRASYSNYDNNDSSGIQVEIAAPGGSDGDGVLSTLNNGTTSPNPTGYVYVNYQGTSMATPHVAGIASLLLAMQPSLTPAQVLATLQTTARAFPSGTGRDCTGNPGSVTASVKYCGAGIVDAAAALRSLACGGFSDVLPTANYCDATEWLRNRAVTLGCAAGAYCPGDPVTRASMALFLQRLGVALADASLWKDQALGSINVDAANTFCATTDFAVGDYPRKARLTGYVGARLSAPGEVSLTPVYSSNGGLTWQPLPGSVRALLGSDNATTVASTLVEAADLDLDVGGSYRFALSAGRVAGSGDVASGTCNLRVELRGRSGAGSPFDAAP